jgi:hypothetical protein
MKIYFNINEKIENYYFNIKRNARLFERKILLHVYNDLEQNGKKKYYKF